MPLQSTLGAAVLAASTGSPVGTPTVCRWLCPPLLHAGCGGSHWARVRRASLVGGNELRNLLFAAAAAAQAAEDATSLFGGSGLRRRLLATAAAAHVAENAEGCRQNVSISAWSVGRGLAAGLLWSCSGWAAAGKWMPFQREVETSMQGRSRAHM